MILLSAPCRQLVVEAALAGVNHSLLAEARDIAPVNSRSTSAFSL